MGTLTFDAVRRLGLSMPDVLEGTAYGSPALKLKGKTFACIPVNKSAEANSLGVHIDLGLRAKLLEQHPDIYYITEHYAPYPTVLVRLSRITRDELEKLLTEACSFAMLATEKSAAKTGRPKAKSKAKKH